MRTETAPSYQVSIFVAGEYGSALHIASGFCVRVGLCVTVTETTYVHSDAEEVGVIVGLINYPRFPKTADEIDALADALALELMAALNQQSVSVQTPKETRWFTLREADQ